MDRSSFLKKLKAINSALNPNGIIAAHSHYCFDGADVTAYDDVIAMWAPCELGVQGGVDGSKLYAIVNSLDTESIEVTPSGESVLVKGGRTKLLLNTLPLKDFTFQLPAEQCNSLPWNIRWTQAFKQCLVSMSEDISQQQGTASTSRTGITLSCLSNSVELYATDNASLVQAVVTTPVIPQLVGSKFVLSPKFCSTLVKTLDSYDCLSLMFGQSFVCAAFADVGSQAPNLYLMGRLISGADTDQFNRVISNASAGLQFTAMPEGLTKSVERSIMIGGKQLNVSIANRELQLLTKVGNGEIEDKITLDHADTDLALDPERLKPAIQYGQEIAFSNACVSLQSPGFRFLLSAKV